jgi:CubicO group peptidase (beta-lactamase class C family)
MIMHVSKADRQYLELMYSRRSYPTQVISHVRFSELQFRRSFMARLLTALRARATLLTFVFMSCLLAVSQEASGGDGYPSVVQTSPLSHAGVSTSRANVAWMIDSFKKWAARNSVPNAVLVIREPNGPGGTETVGGIWTADTHRPIASTSKAITAICIQFMLDGGQLRLDQDVRYLGTDFSNQILSAFQGRVAQVTVEDLFRHTSGFTVDPTQGASFATGAFQPNPAEWFALQAFNNATFGTPGAVYNYNNVNYDILGLIIRRGLSQSYEDACRQNVLQRHGVTGRIPPGSGFNALGAHGGWEISANELYRFL